MRRVFEAFREWLALRERLRDERRFHLDQAVGDLRALGLSPRLARRAARSRFGRRAHGRVALKEIGGDLLGLLRLLRAYRIAASLWLQPLALMASLVLMLLVSPAPRLLVESVAGIPLRSEPTIYFSAPAPWPLSSGVTMREFEKMRTMHSVRGLERYQTVYARAQAAPGAGLAAIQSELRAVTRNTDLYAISSFQHERIETGPAIVISIIVALGGLFLLARMLPGFGIRLLIYALSLGLLHILASVTAWALALQILMPFPTGLASGLALSSLLVAWLLLVGLQYRAWRRDLFRRCPVCLERMLLASTEGVAEHVLLSAAVTESVCAHGHGLLVESRWQRHFSREEEDFASLIRI